MLDIITKSVIENGFSISSILLCIVISLVAGLSIAYIHMIDNKYSKSFIVTLVLLPVIVQMLIMLVNGNLGAGVAAAGAFSLVRFRSVPGSSRDLCSIFFAMVMGIATGMGYIFYAILFLVTITLISITLYLSNFGSDRNKYQSLKITIPENLDYEEIFDDIFYHYTLNITIENVKTTNLGSLYEVSYLVQLKPDMKQKEFIDALRCRNGNLNITLGRPATIVKEEL